MLLSTICLGMPAVHGSRGIRSVDVELRVSVRLSRLARLGAADYGLDADLLGRVRMDSLCKVSPGCVRPLAHTHDGQLRLELQLASGQGG
jgi:hypothetical protein